VTKALPVGGDGAEIRVVGEEAVHTGAATASSSCASASTRS